MSTTTPSPDTSAPVRAGAPAPLLNHLVAALLAALAVFFTAWFVVTNPAMAGVFRFLGLPWSWGNAFDGAGLAWGVAGVAVFTIIGWIYLDGLELYLPRTAKLALAYIFGLGLAGFVFECLSIPYLLTRQWTALALVGLVLILFGRVWLAGRRPPESGVGGGAEWREQVMRRVLARQAWQRSLIRPSGFWSRLYCALALLLTGAITFFIFWHALLYPEVYWDSLILYLGYARQTFLAHGFPVKVTGQVGIGLGANYPHLFSVLGSGVAALSGFWSELPQRLIAPLAGLATTVLIYHTALRMTRHVGLALTVALLYRATPLGIIYDQYASDYALALLFGAAFLYLALLYIETGLTGHLAASALLIALAMHLNYLMGILWVPWALAVALAHSGAARRPDWLRDPAIAAWSAEAPWTVLERRDALLKLCFSRRLWLILLGAGVIGSTWYVRNWIVTGNPVYAFFYKILGGRHVSDEVMKASAIEWGRNGWGIGVFGDTLGERLRGTWAYFTGMTPDGSFRFRMYYQTAPLALGFAAGGFLAWLGLTLAAPWTGRGRAVAWGAPLRFGAVVVTLLLGLLAFHYVLAPFYLYQIIDILPCLALLVVFAWPFVRLPGWRAGLGLLALFVGVVPGLANSLMGYKVVNAINDRRPIPDSQINLYPLRHPLPSTRQMYRWRYGDDEKMWDYINRNLKGQRLLTHENRDLVLDPSITIVNLDDWTDQWNIQALWKLPSQAERVRTLYQKYKIYYYLYVPNEETCPTNKNMGAAEWEKLGLAKRIYPDPKLEVPDLEQMSRLYELQLPPENGITTPSAPSLIMTLPLQAPRLHLPPPAPTPAATASPTPAPSQPPTPAPTAAPTPKPSPTQAPTASPTPAPPPPAKPSPAPSSSPTPAPTPSPAPTATPAPSPTPSPTPKPAEPPKPAPTLQATATPAPTPQPTATPPPTPAPQATPGPSPAPTAAPTPAPPPKPAESPKPAAPPAPQHQAAPTSATAAKK